MNPIIKTGLGFSIGVGLGLIMLGIGAALCLTGIGAIIGIPLILSGLLAPLAFAIGINFIL